MSGFNVIILAGGEKGPLYESTGHVQKALIPIHGTPMVSRVIDAFHKCEDVENIVVVGSADLDHLDSMKHVHKRISTGFTLIQNILHAIAYVKHRLYKSASKHNGYVISFCDAVFLTPQIISDTLNGIKNSQADIVLHYVEKHSFKLEQLPTTRTYIPIDGKLYTGSTIYYVRRFKDLLAITPKLAKLRKVRKSPEQLLETIGCSGLDLAGIQSSLSRQLGINVQLCVSPHARLGMDVDKPLDLELAIQLLDSI
ncbi:MAG: hypothetical protein CMJ76_10955 [Planctomycetaceae bacterium]|nr:hypothetical protein [Planctomycetaceae bacterium]